MTRTEFIKGYAARSDLSDKWAALGFIQIGDRVTIALPCACGEDRCEGWAMVGGENVLHHLQFNAPERLRMAYMEAVGALTSGQGCEQ